MPHIEKNSHSFENFKKQVAEIVIQHSEVWMAANSIRKNDIHRADEMPMIGDIIIMGNKPGVIFYQSMKRGKISRYSHAAISLGGNLYLDSLPKKGVGVRRLGDIQNPKRIKVFRKTNFQADDQFVNHMISFYGSKYSIKGLTKFKKIFHDIYDESLFCSELIDKIYGNASDFNVAGAKFILPCDLENLSYIDGWVDVTEIYLDERCESSDILRAAENSVIAVMSSIRSTKFFNYALTDFEGALNRRREFPKVRLR